ncbi:unnamed protein product [Dicrocoelium dendriticum]|nr:unnamed protein product [Dicrocoelium dendriticum]
MSSNFYYGGVGSQSSNVLIYPMKALNLGPSISSVLSPGALGQPLAFNRPTVNAAEFSMPHTQRVQNSRGGVFHELAGSSLGNVTSCPSRSAVLSNIGITSPNNLMSNPNGMFKMGDRLGTPVRSPDSDDVFATFRLPVPGQSSSKVLSSLQDTNQLSFNNALSDLCSSFVLNRFGVNNDRFSPDAPHTRSDGPSSDFSQLNVSSTSLDALLSGPSSFASLLSSPIKPSVSSSLHLHPLTNSTVPLPPEKPMVDLNSTSKSSIVNRSSCPRSSGSHYYSDQQLDDTRDLQATGALKAAAWIMVPPVPEVTAAHMRTGRVHELKSRACTDRVFNSSYMDHELKQVLHNKVQACLFTSDGPAKDELPRNLGAYTDLVPLEAMHPPRVSVTFGVPTVCFKAWSPRFNRPMLLRRVVLPTDHEAALSSDAYLLAKQLSESDHSALVGFRDIFFTNAFNDNSAVVVYEYTPCSCTVQQTHMSDPMKLTSFSSPFNVTRAVRPHSSLKSTPSDIGMLPESVLCSYIIQLVHGLRFIHLHLNRACNVLDPSKILIQDGTRLRINCFGLKDVLFHRSDDPNLPDDQANDFVQLGKLLIGVACGTSEAIQMSQRATSFNLLQRAYRAELVTLIRGLISGQITDVNQLTHSTAPFFYDQLTAAYDHSDFLERQLVLGMECDRLFRMICKLQSVVERADRNGTNPDWAETGDRYMLKLFRDFVFHQTDSLGAPYLDLAHVIATLNKVEAGSAERLCLVSRDSQNVIIVTYADVKQWLDSSFDHLVERHRQSRCELQLAQQREARKQQQQQQQSFSTAQSQADTISSSKATTSSSLLTSETS